MVTHACVCTGCIAQGNVVVPEDVLAKQLWGFDYDERWLQCFISLAFTGFFMLIAVVAGAKVRHVK